MNIFILNEDPAVAASMMCDKHVVKMTTETAQLLCTTHRLLTDESLLPEVIYRKTHANHPCTVWVRESSSNYDWTYQHFMALCREYTTRYGKTHLCEQKFATLLTSAPAALSDVGLTPYAKACGEELNRVTDAVSAYQEYYRQKQSAMSMTWKTPAVKPHFMH